MPYTYANLVTKETTIESPFTAVTCEPYLSYECVLRIEDIPINAQFIAKISEAEYDLWFQAKFL